MKSYELCQEFRIVKLVLEAFLDDLNDFAEINSSGNLKIMNNQIDIDITDYINSYPNRIEKFEDRSLMFKVNVVKIEDDYFVVLYENFINEILKLDVKDIPINEDVRKSLSEKLILINDHNVNRLGLFIGDRFDSYLETKMSLVIYTCLYI